MKAEDLKRLKRELAVPCETNGWGKLFTRCQVNGVECRLLVDTCCSYTFFDMPFVERAFGRDAVRNVKDPRAAVSNIDSYRESGSALKLHGVSMSISGVEFGGLDVPVIDGDWDESDGMLGLDVLGSVPTLVSVGDRKLVFNLRERKGFKSYTAGRYVPGGHGPNCVIEAVGLPATFRAAVDEVAFAGSVTYIGYAKAPVEYETKLFVQKELTIRGSRNATPQNFRRVLDFARRGLFPIGKMLTKAYGFNDAGQALADWDEAPGKVCRFAVKV